MMAQLPCSGQVPVRLPVQQGNGTVLAVQILLGSQPLQARPWLPAGPVVQANPLYGPPTQVLATLHVPPPRQSSAALQQGAPGFEPPLQVPRQLPCEPPPGAMVRCSGGASVEVTVGVDE